MRFRWNFLNLILFFVYIVASITKFDKMCSSDHLDFRRKPFSLLMPMLPALFPGTSMTRRRRAAPSLPKWH